MLSIARSFKATCLFILALVIFSPGRAEAQWRDGPRGYRSQDNILPQRPSGLPADPRLRRLPAQGGRGAGRFADRPLAPALLLSLGPGVVRSGAGPAIRTGVDGRPQADRASGRRGPAAQGGDSGRIHAARPGRGRVSYPDRRRRLRRGSPAMLVSVPTPELGAALGPTGAAAVGQGARRPPRRPPGPAAWSGVDGSPPAGEGRFVPDHVLCVLRDGLSDAEITRFLRRHRMARTAGGRQRIELIGSELFRYRITDSSDMRRVISRLRRDPRVRFAQPDYVYALAEGGAAASRTEHPQYVVRAMHLEQAHALVKGEKVRVALIDSAVDAGHPELAGAIVKQIDVIGDNDLSPHPHGTAMAGAIVAKSQLTGVAPAAQIVAVRAFSPRPSAKASGTSFALVRAVDGAVTAGARVINLSFAGPADPILSRALKRAHERGIVLVAAMGNAGPGSASRYPAADPSVIAVTATDADDRLFPGATQGSYVALAAPGVDVLVPAPHAEYGLSTGTSVAAAHVSGVVALLLARNAALSPERIRSILVTSARAPLRTAPDPAIGAGIADAYRAVLAADAGPVAKPGASQPAAAADRPAVSMQ